MNIEKMVIKALKDQLGMPDKMIDINSDKESLMMDSLDDIECIMMIEEVFDLEIPDEDAEKLQAVKQVIEYVTKAVSVKST